MSDASPAFDERTFDTLLKLVGGTALRSFLDRLEAQMTASLGRVPETPDDLAALRYEAHALASTSGMMGFTRLSKACIALETLCDARGDVSIAGTIPGLAGALDARDEAKALVPRLRSRMPPAIVA